VTPYNYAESEPVGSIDLWGLQRWKSTDDRAINGPYKNQRSVDNAVRVIHGISTFTAYTLVKSEIVRNEYKSKVSALNVEDAKGRSDAKIDARSKTPVITRVIAENMRPISKEGTRTGGTANKTNTGVNKTVAVLGTAGKAAGALSIGISVYKVAMAENKVESVAKEGGAIAGAVAGGTAGGEAGALVGSAFGGVGAVPGAFVGGIVGSIVGAIVGSDAGKAIHDFFLKPEKQ
jgi:hypothetical protein